MSELPAPLLVEDAGEEWWRTRTPEYRATMTAWLASQGIDVADLMRIEVYLLDTPFARLVVRVRGEDGKLLTNPAREAILHRTETVLLSSLPPSREV
jgi:hypothetical protein